MYPSFETFHNQWKNSRNTDNRAVENFFKWMTASYGVYTWEFSSAKDMTNYCAIESKLQELPPEVGIALFFPYTLKGFKGT